MKEYVFWPIWICLPGVLWWSLSFPPEAPLLCQALTEVWNSIVEGIKSTCLLGFLIFGLCVAAICFRVLVGIPEKLGSGTLTPVQNTAINLTFCLLWGLAWLILVPFYSDISATSFLPSSSSFPCSWSCFKRSAWNSPT